MTKTEPNKLKTQREKELLSTLTSFRVRCRNANELVPTSLMDDDHRIDICVFCGKNEKLTKEHVLPRWIFEGCPDREFTIGKNQQSQKYNRTTVPCCEDCNGNYLGKLENYIKDMISNVNLSKGEYFKKEELENIIRWLETIDYKFQVNSLKKKFLKHTKLEFIPFLRDIPLAMFDSNADTSFKVFSRLKKSHKKMSIKNKSKRINFLLILKSKNPSFHFAHTNSEFIYLDLAKYGVAFFYFFNKNFNSHEEAFNESWDVLSNTIYKN